jgi:hypothetical protein
MGTDDRNVRMSLQTLKVLATQYFAYMRFPGTRSAT